uniref:Oligosaccharyltransferase complex subunit n=1 Tax=Canis lupus dingo TaxID=286419 RepID=A0A8C0L870_CANLU
METLYRVPFLVLECPNLKLKKPPWVHMPSAMTVYALVVVSYFLITGGIIYDVIVEPPSVGSMTDEHGHQRPVAFLAYRVNGQYIMEGLASTIPFLMGAQSLTDVEAEKGLCTYSRNMPFRHGNAGSGQPPAFTAF